MPLTDEPITLHGGCNCNAIRYRAAIPTKSERPPFIAGGATAKPLVTAPIIATDHCNDCRRANGAIINHWISIPLDMVTTSFVEKDVSSVPPHFRLDEGFPRGDWRPAREVFLASDAEMGKEKTYLGMFRSSEGRRRYFCSRCGTQFGYNVHPTPEDWPGVELLDLLLGSFDRENLEGDHLSPERQVWWDVGIPWVQKQSVEGLGIGIPIHPGAWVDKTVKYGKSFIGDMLWFWGRKN